jgi:hypothetical protein
VLRQLSSDTADFVPLRVRNHARYVAVALLGLAAVALVLAFVAGRTEQGTPGGAAPQGSGNLRPVRFAASAATDYDPAGDGRESPTDARNAIDGERSTLWDTERYDGELTRLKPGVGLYVDTGAPVAARQLDVITSMPGWEAEIFAAEAVPKGIEGWTRVSGRRPFEGQTDVRLDTGGRRFRYYLVWIVSLPPGRRASIDEMTLLR